MAQTGLISRITQIFTKTRAVRKIEETTSSGYPQDPMKLMTATLNVSNEAAKIIQECQTMWGERGQNNSIVRVISTYLTKGGFSIQVIPKEKVKGLTAEEQQAQEILNSVVKRTNLLSLIKGWMTALPRDGRLFVEVEVADNQIARLTKLTPNITTEKIDNKGRTYREGGKIDVSNAFVQQSYTMSSKVEFADWQIMRIYWNPIQGEEGNPQFVSFRRTHKKIQDAEDCAYLRRKMRAGQKLHHKIGTPEDPGTPEVVMAYKNEQRKELVDPLAISKDYYTSGNVTIAPIGGDSGVTQIADIEYMQDQYFGVGGVPLLLIPGYEKITLRAGAEQSIEGFLAWIQDCNEMIAEEMKRSIFDFELLLNNINPDSISYKIVWGEKAAKDDAEFERRVIEKRKAGLVSQETAMRELGIEDVEGEIAKINVEMEKYPQVPVETGVRYYVGANPLGLTGGLARMGETKLYRRMAEGQKK